MHPTKLTDVLPYYSAIVKALAARLLGKSHPIHTFIHRPMTVASQGLIFFTRSESIDLAMVALSTEPIEVTRFFRPSRDSVVVDVGANIGGYSIRLAPRVHRVVAIEPEPHNYEQLLAHIRQNHITNVVPMQAAISDRRGRATFHLAEDAGRHSLESSAWGIPTGQTIEVETLLLDEVVDMQGLTSIDWLKIDVERHELAVLRGGTKALRMTRNLILEFELSQFAQVRDIVCAHGLKILWHHDHQENSYLLATSITTA
jgi:FkbM family methyltransferase